MKARRTLTRMAKLAWKVRAEALVSALNGWQPPRGFLFLFTYLSDLEELSRRPRPCAECGTNLKEYRSDARYCSPSCRQRAYRKRRVTARLSSTDTEASRGDGSHCAERGLAITAKAVAS
jgi:hypothetical protein